MRSRRRKERVDQRAQGGWVARDDRAAGRDDQLVGDAIPRSKPAKYVVWSSCISSNEASLRGYQPPQVQLDLPGLLFHSCLGYVQSPDEGECERSLPLHGGRKDLRPAKDVPLSSCVR